MYKTLESINFRAIVSVCSRCNRIPYQSITRPSAKMSTAESGNRYKLPVIRNTGITDTTSMKIVYMIIRRVAFLFFSPVGIRLNPAFLYSSNCSQPMAQKCGNCQKNCIMNNMPGSMPN